MYKFMPRKSTVTSPLVSQDGGSWGNVELYQAKESVVVPPVVRTFHYKTLVCSPTKSPKDPFTNNSSSSVILPLSRSHVYESQPHLYVLRRLLLDVPITIYPSESEVLYTNARYPSVISCTSSGCSAKASVSVKPPDYCPWTQKQSDSFWNPSSVHGRRRSSQKNWWTRPFNRD